MNRDSQSSPVARLFYGLGCAAIIIAALSLGRSILIPLALAVLLSFLLSPMVTWLRRLHLPRVAAVIVVVVLALVPVVGVGYMVGQQLVTLIESLPGYRENIIARVELVRGQSRTVFQRVSTVFDTLTAATRDTDDEDEEASPDAPIAPPASGVLEEAPPRLEGQAAATVAGVPATSSETDPAPDTKTTTKVEKPIPVEVHSNGSVLTRISELGGMVLSPIGSAAVVVILVIFILLQREDLRDRVIEIVGRSRVKLTIRALEDAGHRISRYLLMQAIINMAYGVPVGVGLWLLGLPGAALWGLMATVLRFIPYLGPWMAASMPILLSLAVFEGWSGPLMVIGLFVVLELFSNNVMEPWLYGTSTGMSQIAVILAMVFWGWIWGPIGILLAVPMTVCLVVAGKYIRPLEFFTILLGDRPTVATTGRFYRALVDDQQAVTLEIAELYAQERERLEVYDGLLIPALKLVEIERHEGSFDAARQRQIHAQIRMIMDRLVERDRVRAQEAQRAQEEAVKVAQREGDAEALERFQRTASEAEEPDAAPSIPVICLPAHDESDHLSAAMLADVLQQRGITVTLADTTRAPHDCLPPMEEGREVVVCLSMLPSLSLAQVVAICSRITGALGNRKTPLIVGAWGAQDHLARYRRKLRKAGATRVVAELQEAVEVIEDLVTEDE